MELDVLKVWPDWKATRLIGEGSFGKVYEIVRSNFGIEEHCALKVISVPSSDAELQSMRNEGLDDAGVTEYYRGFVEEFVQEIALMSKLKGNVNIVGYEDYAVVEHKDSIGWDIMIRMELLTALPKYIRENSFSVNDVLKLGIDVCNALEVCHEQRIIHRDIKPDNIFVSQNGSYKLGDFGVARTIEKTMSGLSKKGTFTYMAPEVYKGEAYGINVDLYSLGIVMYKLLNNNREPFLPPPPEVIKYSDKNEALVKRMSGIAILPPLNSNELLSKVILKSINFKAGERYQTPSQMKMDLVMLRNSSGTEVESMLRTDYVPALNTYATGQNLDVTEQPKNISVSADLKVSDELGKPETVKDSDGTKTKGSKRNKILRPIATTIGWIGVAFWVLLFSQYDTKWLVLSLVLMVCQILLCFKKLDILRIPLSIIVILVSIYLWNVFNFVSAILYLCMKKEPRLKKVN